MDSDKYVKPFSDCFEEILIDEVVANFNFYDLVIVVYFSYSNSSVIDFVYFDFRIVFDYIVIDFYHVIVNAFCRSGRVIVALFDILFFFNFCWS